ncbi:TetR/AcrR family transcriptional regulator [Nonomuraea rhizosphaerae]|uniref:TetR/AcrR family transcriptional regulator n=1 Tax=Nonomuraea rhizosphaerae TaxID=2665663 RepID=UPI001C5E0436|nr:TetR family transcriptional regulator [Nonomuraea rhizosphaerae]
MTERAQRRRRTEERILASARSLFAELGFERTTIRAVAKAAAVDPALVMQYFGSKQGLFSAAVRVAPPLAAHGDTDELVEQLVDSLGLKMGELPQSSLAMMRSMLTHPEAAVEARAVLSRQIAQVAESITGDDARLRAALLTTIMLGVTVGHQLLELDELRAASQKDIARILRPALRAIADTEE